MKPACLFCFLVSFAAGVPAQQTEAAAPTLTVRSTLVLAPVLVKTKKGQVIFDLTAEDFLVTDNGVLQNPTLVQDTDSQPLALAIVVETGGAGALHLSDYRQLDAILDSLVGGVEHRVSLIGFDSAPHLLTVFTPDTTVVSGQLASLMTRLADFMEKEQVRRSQMMAALTYPMVLIGVAVLAVTFLLVFVIPMLSGVFKDLGAALPLPTVLLLPRLVIPLDAARRAAPRRAARPRRPAPARRAAAGRMLCGASRTGGIRSTSF